MLNDTDVQTMLPVRDLKSAEKFYEDVLGLTRTGGQPDMVSNYLSGITSLCVYRSEFAGTNKGTAALWQVDDVDATVKSLKAKGVAFEHYDLPGLKLDGDIHRAGSFGVAWFKDPAGNILSVQSKPTKP